MSGRDLVRRLREDDARLGDLSMYADDLGLAPRDGEGEQPFRERVAGELRRRGQVIEAHEVIVGCRYDDPANGACVMRGVIGASAAALHDRVDARDPVRQVGDEIAMGVIASAPLNPGREALLAMFGVFGADAMTVIDAFGRHG